MITTTLLIIWEEKKSLPLDSVGNSVTDITYTEK